MTALESIGLINNLLISLNSSQFLSTEIKVKLQNSCTDKVFIKVFKTEDEFKKYTKNINSSSGCASIDFMLLEGLTISNNNIPKSSHIFYAYNLGDTKNIILNQKAIYVSYNSNSNNKTYKGYENLLLNLLKGYSIQRSGIVIPNSNDLYVECCYVEDDYVD